MRGRTGRGRGRTSRAQTETIGMVLILGMTLTGATIALAFGATALNDARITSQEGGIEQAMTQLDSRSAMVGLGDSTSQRVPLAGTNGGAYRVDQDAGWINITHHNYSGTDSEVIFNETLGALVYENGDTTIAYQGGGVWAREGDSSRMVSPPEFHYRGATLTLPVIRLEGTSGAGGSGVVAEITQLERAHRIYPNVTQPYSDGSQVYANPITEGNVTVTVKSEFYQAWADYFRTRTTGKVTVFEDEETVRVLLISQGVSGDFEMPADGNSIEIRGLSGGHPIEDFNITIRPDDQDSANFANLQWTLWAEKGSQQLEIHLRDGGANDDGGTSCTERFVDVTVYYSENNGNDFHGWHKDGVYNTSCADLDGDGDDDETFLKANLITAKNLTVDESIGSSELQHFSTGGSNAGSITWDEHGDSFDWEQNSGKDFNDGDRTSMDNVTNHYLELMGPSVEITVEDKGSNTVNEAASSGILEQSGGTGQFITFLHITENRVEISLK